MSRRESRRSCPSVMKSCWMEERSSGPAITCCCVSFPAGVRCTDRSGKRPFVIVDPRAGHGPGIGGFKPDSQIGNALEAGHPCYFIGFLPEPVPGQTLGDVASAEAAFIEQVHAMHPDAQGKPCVIANCQAGWAIMAMGAIHPDLMGPMIIAGSPLSYWAGVKGRTRCATRALSGGTWLTALPAILGNGRFDGSLLVSNFERLNPSHTYWSNPTTFVPGSTPRKSATWSSRNGGAGSSC